MIIGLTPYLVMDGNGQEAIKFYENVLDAKIVSLQTFGDLPDAPDFPIPVDAKERVLNASLKIGNTDLMLSDTFPGPHQSSYQLGSQVTIAITVNTVEKSKDVFAKLLEGGQEVMALEETFWSPSYGQVTDKFGVTWHVSTDVTATK